MGAGAADPNKLRATLGNSKSLHWNFRLILDYVLVPAVLYAIQWQKFLDNWKLKPIVSVN